MNERPMRLTLQDLLDAAGDLRPEKVMIKILHISASGDGYFHPGEVNLEDNTTLVIE